MEKKLLNEEALNINGKPLEAAMEAYIKDKSQENLKAFMEALKVAQFLVPVEFPKKIDPEIIEKMKKKEPLRPEERPRMVPVLLTNKQGDRLAPAFTSKEQLPEKITFTAILPVKFGDVLRVAQAPDVNAKGILVNPGTTKLIINPSLLKMMEKVVQGESVEKQISEHQNAAGGKKEIKMTPEQFHLFIRRNMEVGVIPKRAFQEKAKFMDELSDKREQMILDIYKSAYKAPVPFPYEEKDFDVMVLDISDTVSVASIGLPAKNLAPGIASSVYVVYNPQADEVKYFTIEKTKEEEQSKLGQVMEDGSYTVLGDAPAAGCEISGILDLLEQ